MGMGQPPDTPGGRVISNRHGTFQVEDVYVVFGAGAERIVYWDRETGEYVCLPTWLPVSSTSSPWAPGEQAHPADGQQS